MPYINLQIKYWAKINTGIGINMNLWWKMTCLIHLTTRHRNKNSPGQSITVIINVQHPKDQNVYVVEDTANKMMH